MAVLHGSWVVPAASSSDRSAAATQLPSAAGFFLWGESWCRATPHKLSNRPAANGISSRRTPKAPGHPYAMGAAKFGQWLLSLQQSGQLQWPTTTLSLTDLAAGSTQTTDAWRSLPVLLPSHVLTAHEPAPDAAFTAAAAIASEITLEDIVPETAAPKSYGVLPQHSGASSKIAADAIVDDDALVLYPWRISGIWLKAADAVALLHSLPLSLADQESAWGSDLRFWSHVSRWQLDLLTRSKFVPQLVHRGDMGTTQWRPLLDSAVDQGRLVHFERCMPTICRSYSRTHTKGLPAAHATLFSFLTHTIDAKTRAIASSIPLPTAPLPRDLPLRDWLQCLTQSPRFEADAEGIRRLDAILATWLAPIQRHLSETISPYRVAFVLHTPSRDNPGAPGNTWRLEYGLQALDDTNIFLEAETIWQNPVAQMVYKDRTINAPQETLLLGLGIASRLYPIIAPSLD
ncbi:MAG: hypothetical protein WBA10_06880, partial [Elainellaceae cyanobacterium]